MAEDPTEDPGRATTVEERDTSPETALSPELSDPEVVVVVTDLATTVASPAT